MENIMKYILVSFLIFSAGLSQAQERLTLEDSRRMALENSENIQIARLQIEKARADKDAMRTLYLPSFSANATGIYLHKDIEMEMYLPTVKPDPLTGQLLPNVMRHPVTGEIVMGPDGLPVFNTYAWLPLEVSLQGAWLAGIAVEQPLYAGGKISAGNSMARIGVDMASENLNLQRTETIYETDQAYWLYVSVQEKVKLADMYVHLLNELEKQVQHAYEAGLVNRNDWLKVAVRHHDAKILLQQARSGKELARMALCRLVGLPLQTELETMETGLASNRQVQMAQGPVDVSKRPEYRILQRQVDFAEENMRMVRADFLPTAGLRVGYQYIGGVDLGLTTYNEGNTSIMASVTIPLFHWGEGRKKQLSARHAMQIRQAELEKNTSFMLLEVEQARLYLIDALTRVQLLEQAMEQAEENLSVHQARFELELDVLTDLLEAQVHWQSAFGSLIDARTDLRLRETAYLKAKGLLD